MLVTNINSIGSFTKVMDSKFLLEPRNRLIVLQKNYQALFLPDQFVAAGNGRLLNYSIARLLCA